MVDPGDIVLPEPLAYFLTWATCGVWLPGDERGWTQHDRGFKLPDPVKKLEASARMTEHARLLDTAHRTIGESTVASHCTIRKWVLHAMNCRSNHMHVVVMAPMHPNRVRNQLKAWCTRRLREYELSQAEGIPTDAAIRTEWWAECGSKRYINDEQSLEAAIVYVRDGQD